jgi:beta-lactamase superfamily II metal-dependent hydrolase
MPHRSPTARAICAALLVLAGIEARAGAQPPQAAAPTRIGDALPPWTPGTLDIHQIATGRGNSALIVFPDGTALLVDAGGTAAEIPQSEPHPDGSRSPGEWIARYAKRHLADSAAGIDYAMLTHFHSDHIGAIADVARGVRIGTIIDRGFPDYAYPAPLEDPVSMAYRRFVEGERARGLVVERFRPGARDQIRLRRNAAAYPAVEVRNIIGNGEAWTGTGTATRQLFPTLASTPRPDWPNENMLSLGIRIAYGAFRFYTGGDLPGTGEPGFPAWHSAEALVAPLIGRVDVHVVNQHGSMGEETAPFQQALASPVVIIPSWAPSHPAPDVLKRMVESRLPPTERSIFATEMRDATKIVIGQRVSALAGPPGHVVVRVEPGGGRYWVMVLSNADESDRVVAVKGPFVAGAGR